MKIEGVGTNRRGGMHFFCDSATSTNRHNSYMVYFRVDQDKVQIYKYVNNVYTLETDDDCVVDSGAWFNCKVIYDKTTGAIDVYKDNFLVSSWTDPSPYTVSGDYISLRTGNANVTYKNIGVFTERQDTTHHFILNGENAFQVFSLIRDGNKNLSQIAVKLIYIDTAQTNAVKIPANRITVFPNPVTGELFLNFPQKLNGTVNITVYNAAGQQLISEKTNQPAGYYRLNTSDLKPGNYFLILTHKGQIFKAKFVKE